MLLDVVWCARSGERCVLFQGIRYLFYKMTIWPLTLEYHLCRLLLCQTHVRLLNIPLYVRRALHTDLIGVCLVHENTDSSDRICTAPGLRKAGQLPGSLTYILESVIDNSWEEMSCVNLEHLARISSVLFLTLKWLFSRWFSQYSWFVKHEVMFSQSS